MPLAHGFSDEKGDLLVVIQSVMSAMVGSRLRWHKLRRTGGVQVAGSPGEDPKLGPEGRTTQPR